jgi:hypothetical protein
VLICESDRRVKRKPLVNKYKPIAWIANTQTRTIKLFINVAGKNAEWRGPASPFMSSYHIQDLRLVLPSPDLDLRVNKHCAQISASFREWLQESLRGDAARAEELSEHRFDLLCSLCFPTIDPPQLLRVSKLCALTFLANDGGTHAETSPSQWLLGYVSCVEPMFEALNQSALHSGSALSSDLLNPEHFLEIARSIRTRQAQESKHSPPVALNTNILLRFTSDLLSSYYSSRETNSQNSHLGLLEFFAVLEAAYDRNFSEGLLNVTLLSTLWRRTINIIMWSQVILRRKQFLVAAQGI